MNRERTILVVGTYDTKQDELQFIADVIREQGGRVLTMDVSVLGEPDRATDISKHEVAQAGGHTIEQAIGAGDENLAMQIMATGAAHIAADLVGEQRVHGVIALGGTMGTDLALDVCSALPLGVPKLIVSTVAFSPMIPPERLPPDVQMILWAGGLYGLNEVCRGSLSQAAGAVLGAARAARLPARDRPMIGMTSFGKTVLRYMVTLKPALQARGFEVAVFHATGMGGRAFESLAASGAFACVLDFATQELGNQLHGSSISAGPDRLTGAGRAGVPQLVAPGCYDLVDLVGWQAIPSALEHLPRHAHNRLLTSVVLDEGGRRAVARAHCERLALARGPTSLLLPVGGCNEWDRPGAPLHDAAGMAAFVEETTRCCPANVSLQVIDGHINDPAFADAALAIVDDWLAAGIIAAPPA
ncbi:MAG: Tm-1-like ATP-binding domain-containing protein [Burkholderiaceae bacterium]